MRLIVIAATLAAVISVQLAFAATGTWTPLKNGEPVSGVALLLTDGTVMVEQSEGTAWYRLKPDSSGSYVNGTWTQLASMHDSRLYFASAVLKDGRVFVAGGEYGTGNASAEIYDPLKDAWTYTSPTGVYIDDSACEVLPDGRVLILEWQDHAARIYDPVNDTWTVTSNRLNNEENAEASFVKLPDGSILTSDYHDEPNAQRYLPSSNQWVSAGAVPVALWSGIGEIGPGVLLYDGRALFLGGSGNTALYTLGTNSWQTGPVIPNGMVCDDAPGAVMPNGHVLFLADFGNPEFSPPSGVFEYDPFTTSITKVADPYSGFSSGSAYYHHVLVLPTGQVLLDGSYIYTPIGSPNAAWQPTVSSIAANGDGSFTVTGTQLNGLTEGAAYGDDGSMASNYPIIRLVDGGGTVYYARTYNFSTMGVATGSTPVSANFTVAGIPNGSYSLYVVANGIASDAVSFTVGGMPPPMYTLTVNSGSGSGSYTAGTAVTITANAAPVGQVFSQWTGATVANPAASTTSLTMPAANTMVTATYVSNGAPVITSATTASPNPATVNASVAFAVAASDADGDTLTYSWAFGDGGTATGASAAHTYTAAGNYTATVTVSDGNGHSVSSSVTETVNSITTVPTIVASPLTVAPGGTVTVSWSGGSVGNYITMSNYGDLSGYISLQLTGGTASGTLTFTAPAPSGKIEFDSYTVRSNAVTVTGSALAPSITSALMVTGTVGSAFSYTITASNSPASFNATGLPAGLSVNTATAVISGTPTAAGTSNVTVSATNAAGTGTAMLVLTINAVAVPTIVASPSTVAPGGTVTVSWSGGSVGNYITMSNYGDLSGYISLQLTGATASGSLNFTAPATSGKIEFDSYTIRSNAVTVTGTATAAAPVAFTVQKVSGTVGFNAPNHNTASLSATIQGLPPVAKLSGASVQVLIGGEQATFKLDGKGHAKSSAGTISIKSKGGSSTINIALKGAAWSYTFPGTGIDPTATNANAKLKVNAVISINGIAYSTAINATYSSKAHVGGKFHN